MTTLAHTDGVRLQHDDQMERLLVATRGLDMVLKGAREAGLPAPFAACISHADPTTLQLRGAAEVRAWAGWIGADVYVGPSVAGLEAHRARGQIFDVTVWVCAVQSIPAPAAPEAVTTP